VLTIGDAIDSVDKASALVDRFATVDDVYSESFAHSVILQSSIGNDSIEQLLAEFKASDHFNTVYHTSPSSATSALPPGPYFLVHGSIHQAYRLYEDELDSFIFGVIPEDVLNPKKF
jgi:hypothetical protein